MLELSFELKRRNIFHPVVGVFENFQNPHLEVAEACRKCGIETIVFPCRGKLDLKAVLQLRRFICARKIDIVHSHGYKSNLYSFFSTRGLSTHLMATCHNWLGDEPKMKFYARLDKFILRRFDMAAAVSEEVKMKMVHSGIADERVEIVRNGVSGSRFAVCLSEYSGREGIKSRNGIPPDSVVVGMVGRLSPEKGHRHLLNVADSLIRLYPCTFFLVVGDGILKNELEREFSSRSILFTGIRKDVDRLYRCMDIFVLPSLTEGMPVVLLEAMASGLPVVATCVGAVSEVVEEGITGLIVEPGDEGGLQKALLFLLSKPDEAIAMGERGRQRVKEHFSPVRMADCYMVIYQKLIDKGTR